MFNYVGYIKHVLLFGLLGLSACASIVSGTTQSVLVNTEPTQASCTLTRDGTVIAVLNPTPHSVKLEKSKNAVFIECSKDGFFDQSAVLDSSFQGMTFGNIIFGGIIGVGVDAASGAMNKYPESITVLLSPTSFESETDRDEFFKMRREFLVSENERRIASIREDCLPDSRRQCEKDVKELEEALSEELRLHESRRLSAEIRSRT